MAPVRPAEQSGKKCIVIRSQSLGTAGLSALGAAHSAHFIERESHSSRQRGPGIVKRGAAGAAWGGQSFCCPGKSWSSILGLGHGNSAPLNAPRAA